MGKQNSQLSFPLEKYKQRLDAIAKIYKSRLQASCVIYADNYLVDKIEENSDVISSISDSITRNFQQILTEVKKKPSQIMVLVNIKTTTGYSIRSIMGLIPKGKKIVDAPPIGRREKQIVDILNHFYKIKSANPNLIPEAVMINCSDQELLFRAVCKSEFKLFIPYGRGYLVASYDVPPIYVGATKIYGTDLDIGFVTPDGFIYHGAPKYPFWEQAIKDWTAANFIASIVNHLKPKEMWEAAMPQTPAQIRKASIAKNINFDKMESEEKEQEEEEEKHHDNGEEEQEEKHSSKQPRGRKKGHTNDSHPKTHHDDSQESHHHDQSPALSESVSKLKLGPKKTSLHESKRVLSKPPTKTTAKSKDKISKKQQHEEASKSRSRKNSEASHESPKPQKKKPGRKPGLSHKVKSSSSRSKGKRKPGHSKTDRKAGKKEEEEEANENMIGEKQHVDGNESRKDENGKEEHEEEEQNIDHHDDDKTVDESTEAKQLERKMSVEEQTQSVDDHSDEKQDVPVVDETPMSQEKKKKKKSGKNKKNKKQDATDANATTTPHDETEQDKKHESEENQHLHEIATTNISEEQGSTHMTDIQDKENANKSDSQMPLSQPQKTDSHPVIEGQEDGKTNEKTHIFSQNSQPEVLKENTNNIEQKMITEQPEVDNTPTIAIKITEKKPKQLNRMNALVVPVREEEEEEEQTKYALSRKPSEDVLPITLKSDKPILFIPEKSGATIPAVQDENDAESGTKEPPLVKKTRLL